MDLIWPKLIYFFASLNLLISAATKSLLIWFELTFSWLVVLLILNICVCCFATVLVLQFFGFSVFLWFQILCLFAPDNIQSGGTCVQSEGTQ